METLEHAEDNNNQRRNINNIGCWKILHIIEDVNHLLSRLIRRSANGFLPACLGTGAGRQAIFISLLVLRSHEREKMARTDH